MLKPFLVALSIDVTMGRKGMMPMELNTDF